MSIASVVLSGAWTVGKTYRYYGREYVPVRRTGKNGIGWTIALIVPFGEDAEPGDLEMARLIAAAPTLAEALRECQREFDAVLAGTQMLDAETMAETVRAALAEAGL